MKLQFLVNHYKEPPETVARLLDSIAMQKDIDPVRDYNVLICNDGDDNVLDADFLNGFPFKIIYRIMPHRGVCATRNTLLDMADAEYVMFCDADDCFSRPEGADVLLDATNDGKADAVSAPFLEEIKVDDRFRLRRIPKNLMWIHSKLFRRQFLIDNDIRFPEEVEHAGDMTFVWQAFHMARSVGSVKHCYYTWKWNGDSLTRVLPYAGARFYGSEIRAYAVLTDKLISCQREDLYQKLILSVVNSTFLYCRFQQWGAAPQEYVDDAKAAIREYVHKFAPYYESIEESVRRRNYSRIISVRRLHGAEKEFQSITSWMEAISE